MIDASKQSFRMVIEDVFRIPRSRTLVIGLIEAGYLEKGDAVFVIGGAATLPSHADWIEIIRPSDTKAGCEYDLPFLLRSVEARYIMPGMIIIKQDETDT